MTDADVVNALVGSPYEAKGRTRRGVDCYGIVLLALRMSGRPVPPDPGIAPDSLLTVAKGFRDHLHEWTPSERMDGAVLLVPSPAHAGLIIAGGILHAAHGRGAEHLPLDAREFQKAEAYLWR